MLKKITKYEKIWSVWYDGSWENFFGTEWQLDPRWDRRDGYVSDLIYKTNKWKLILNELIRQTTEERKKMTKHTVEWMLVWWFIDDLEEIVQSTVNENLTGDDLVEDILEEVDRFIPLRSAEEWDIFEWILHRHLKPKEEVENVSKFDRTWFVDWWWTGWIDRKWNEHDVVTITPEYITKAWICNKCLKPIWRWWHDWRCSS